MEGGEYTFMVPVMPMRSIVVMVVMMVSFMPGVLSFGTFWNFRTTKNAYENINTHTHIDSPIFLWGL